MSSVLDGCGAEPSSPQEGPEQIAGRRFLQGLPGAQAPVLSNFAAWQLWEPLSPSQPGELKAHGSAAPALAACPSSWKMSPVAAFKMLG